MKRGISNWIVLALVFFYTVTILGFVPNTSDADATEVEDFVTRFYELCLGRPPDSAGLGGWVSALRDGTQTGSDVAYGFVFSEEFLSKDTTDEEYLQVLYEAFFDRQPDSAGKQGWLDAIQNGASREDVLNGFIYAQEFNNLCWEYGISPNPIAAFVTRFYQLCLNRSPERAGLDGWTNNLLSQIQTGTDVAEGFIYSPEFIAKNTSNSEYLLILYEAFFDRDPDQGGWDTWLAELDAGKDRGEVLDGFIYSQEFTELSERFGIKAFDSVPPPQPPITPPTSDLTVISTNPEIGATGISRNLDRISVTFSKKMVEGYSVSSLGDWQLSGKTQVYWSNDKKTFNISRDDTINLLPSNRTITIILNPSSHSPNFKDISGNALKEYTFSFTTGIH